MAKVSKMSIIYDFLYNSDLDDKSKIVKDLSDRFKIKMSTANKYYYDFIKEMNEAVVHIEERPALNNKLSREKIRIRDTEKKGKVICGKYINYTIVDNGVIVNGYLFRNEKDLEDFRRREFAMAYKQLGELADVLNSI